MSQSKAASVFRAYLRGLPDEVAIARDRGQPISFPAEFLSSDAARELLESIGVEVVEGDVELQRRARASLNQLLPYV